MTFLGFSNDRELAEISYSQQKIWKTMFHSPCARGFHLRRGAPRVFVSAELPFTIDCLKLWKTLLNQETRIMLNSYNKPFVDDEQKQDRLIQIWNELGCSLLVVPPQMRRTNRITNRWHHWLIEGSTVLGLYEDCPVVTYLCKYLRLLEKLVGKLTGHQKDGKSLCTYLSMDN